MNKKDYISKGFTKDEKGRPCYLLQDCVTKKCFTVGYGDIIEEKLAECRQKKEAGHGLCNELRIVPVRGH